MNNWGANHGAISFGHIGADLIALASILRIPVAMHNVPAEKVFRPKYWASSETLEPEAPTTARARHSGRCTGSRARLVRAGRGAPP